MNLCWYSKCYMRRVAKQDYRRSVANTPVRSANKGIGPQAACQFGDTQGLPDVADVAPENVEKLVKEDQAFETEQVRSMEEKSNPDVAECIPMEVPEDDVPSEYLVNE